MDDEPIRCEVCGKPDLTIELRVDPFQEEIYGVEVEQWMCEQCYKDSANDI